MTIILALLAELVAAKILLSFETDGSLREYIYGERTYFYRQTQTQTQTQTHAQTQTQTQTDRQTEHTGGPFVQATIALSNSQEHPGQK